LACLSPLVFAGDITVSQFGGGLNTQDTPAEIDPTQAQDLLNVNIQPGGASIFKRDGYGLFASLPIACSTCAVHGGYHFQQVGGNDVQLWGNDTELAGSVNDAAFVKLSTGAVGATWQCADSQGFAYCLNSSRDTCIKTDGSSANTSFQSGVPLGTMLAFTPLQLVVAGVSGNESTVYVSGQNAFTNFTIGVLPSSPFTEPIASPGSRITHLAYYFGKLFWWKDQSFGYATFTNQNDWQLTIVSNQIGTLDNSDAFWNSSGFDTGAKFSGTAQANAGNSPGGIFFRGQDNHLYVYDGYYLTRLSRSITPTVTAASRRKANLWTQTTQADFQGGSNVPTNNISETISVGDVIVSSFATTENSSTTWNSGSVINMTVNPSSITLNTNNSGNVPNNDFESSAALNPWSATSYTRDSNSAPGNTCFGAFSGIHGSFFARDLSATGNSATFTASTVDSHTGATLDSQSYPVTTHNCTFTSQTFTVSASNIGKSVNLKFTHTDGSNTGIIQTTNPFVLGGNITFLLAVDATGGDAAPRSADIDNVQNGSSTITSGSFTSQQYNTGFTSATYSLTNFAWTANTSTPTFSIQTSTASSGPWTTLLTSSGTNAVGNQYVRYVSTLSIVGGDSALSAITAATILARSTGTYYSNVKNAPNLTSWSTLNVTDNYVGISSITYYTRSSTNVIAVLQSTPSWVAQTKNATVTASTGTYFQLRADFFLSAATETASINDFTFNWFEGSASDKAYITYFNDAIWFSVSASTSASTNNRIFYWDLLNGAWVLYDIPANGFQIENNALYFGDTIQGRVFKFGSVTTDNAAAINSYWRSKSFLGGDPFVQNEFVQADFVLGESSTTLTYTYTLDSKTSTAYNITAYDSAASLIQRNFLLPSGKIGKYYDFKISDNSGNAAWRLMGHRAHYNALNWQPVLK
jgi:hypothetical protein